MTSLGWAERGTQGLGSSQLTQQQQKRKALFLSKTQPSFTTAYPQEQQEFPPQHFTLKTSPRKTDFRKIDFSSPGWLDEIYVSVKLGSLARSMRGEKSK